MKYPGAALPPNKNVRSPNTSLRIAFEPEMQIGSHATNSSRFGGSKISRSQGAREVFALRVSLAFEQTPAGHIWGDRQIEQAKERRGHISQYSVPYLKIVSVLGDINEMD